MEEKLDLQVHGSEFFSLLIPLVFLICQLMSRLHRVFAVVVAAASLGACSAPASYRITLRDGREFITASRPQMQGKTGYYRYETFQGRDALIRAEEVLLIERDS